MAWKFNPFTKKFDFFEDVPVDWVDSVLDKNLTSPPSNPNIGDRHIIGSPATGGWAGKENQIAEWKGGSWEFTIPTKGCATYVENENKSYVFNGTSWVKFGLSKFIELDDAPSSYTGQASKAVQVKSTEDGLEFQTIISGKRTATKIVAANDSLDKSRADYVCDGVNDEVEINQAFSDLGTTGGTVKLLEGTYNLGGNIVPSSGSILSGVSRDKTIINCGAYRIDAGLNTGILYENLAIQNSTNNSGALNIQGNGNQIVRNCSFSGNSSNDIQVNNSNGTVLIEGCTFASEIGIYFSNCWGAEVIGNHFLRKVGGGSKISFNVNASGSQVTIIGNHFESQGVAINHLASLPLIISGNIFFSSDTAGCGSINVMGKYTVITNNIFEKTYGNPAVLIDGGSYCNISNNIFKECKQEAIKLNKASHCIVANNDIYANGQEANNTYAAILLTDNGTTFSTYNIVNSNRIRSNTTNKPSYGIRENATGDDYNLVYGNIVTDCVTAQISLQGANSVRANNIPATG